MKNFNAKTSIEQTFLKFLEKRPISEITIKDIVNACDLNRNTFYYYYKNIPDLLESVIKKMVDDILTVHPPTYETLEDCFLAAINFASDNKQIISNIYHSTNRAIFERHLWHICDYSISSFFESYPFIEIEPSDSELLVLKDFFKFECFGFAIDWINHGMPEDVKDKIHIFAELTTKIGR